MNKVLSIILLTTLIFSSCAATRIDIIDRTVRSMVRLSYQLNEEETYTCTGFVVNAARGWVLTAKHCITEDGEGMFVDGQPSTVVGQNDSFAMLTITPMTKPPLDIRKEKLNLGDDVLSIGYGYGELMVFMRQVAGFHAGDVALNGLLAPGMSGGPVVDMNGRVVGLNQADYQMIIGVLCGQDEIRDFIKSVK
jgi:S1-C subfamily serine protease